MEEWLRLVAGDIQNTGLRVEIVHEELSPWWDDELEFCELIYGDRSRRFEDYSGTPWIYWLADRAQRQLWGRLADDADPSQSPLFARYLLPVYQDLDPQSRADFIDAMDDLWDGVNWRAAFHES